MNSNSENERALPLSHVLGKRALVYLGILVFAFALLLVFNSSNASAAGPTYVYEDITTSTTWDEEGSPYIVNSSIEILPDVTLTIEANVTVMVDAGQGITVSGTLIAEGTADEMVNFTANSTTPVNWYWNGLYFNSDSSGSVLDWVNVEYAVNGVMIENSSVAISNAMLHNCAWAALWWEVNDGSDLVAELTNVNASDNTGWPMWISGIGMMFIADGGAAEVTLTDCIADNNYASSIVVQATGSVDAAISGTSVSGAGDVGLMIYSTDGDISATLTDVTVAGCGSFGTLIWAPNGEAAVVVDPSEMSGNYESGLQVEALGSVSLTVADTVFTENWIGISVYSEGDAVVDLRNVDFISNPEAGLLVDVDTGNVMLTYAGGTIDDSWWDVGAFINSNEADVEADISNVTFVASYLGLIVTAGGNADVTLVDCMFDGNFAVEAYVYAEGDTTVTMTRTVMNGASANYFTYYYPTEVEAEYAIINPDAYTSGSSMMVTLPFEFPFAGGSYTDIWIYEYGFISVGSAYGGSFPVNIYSSGSNLIIPCQDYFSTNYWPYYGYKVYDDKVIIQWYVVRSGDPDYLKNVFEVVLYPSGDIQFNYADMESLVSSYDYGLVTGGWIPVRLNDVWISSAYDADYRSVYFTRQQFASFGLIAQAEGDLTATITDSSISNYFYSGVALTSYNGDVSVEVMNATFEYILALSGMNAGLVALAPNGTMTALIEGNEFSYIASVAVGLVSAPMWGGEESVTVTDNSFFEVGFMSVIVETMVSDDDGFNELVELTATRTITDNTGEKSGGIATMTSIWTEDSDWNATVVDIIVDNAFTGSPTPIVGLSEPFAVAPMQFGWVGLGSFVDVGTYAGDLNIETTVEIAGNSLDALDVMFGPIAAPLQEIDGIEVIQYLSAYVGAVTWVSNVEVSGNTLNAPVGTTFDHGIYVDIEAWGMDAELNTTVNVDASSNQMLTEDWFGDGGIDVYVGQDMSDGMGSGIFAANVAVERNLMQNPSWGIYVEGWAGLEDQFGDQTADFAISVADNEVTGEPEGIAEVDIYSWAEFSFYFPPYEETVSATQTTTTAVDIVRNKGNSTGWAIGVYTQTYAEEDYYGVFSHAVADTTATWNIADNEVTASGYYGIWFENEVYAYFGQAIATATTDLTISGNSITVPEESDLYEGIYVWDYADAYTYSLRFGDSPTAASMMNAIITENIVTGSVGVGIFVEQYAYSYYGMSMAVSDDVFEIADNEISEYYWDGIYFEVYAYTAQYSDYGLSTSAVADMTSQSIITGNALTTSWDDTIGIYVYVYFNWWDVENGYILADLMADISSNSIDDTSDGEDGLAIYAECYPAEILVVTIADNAITGGAYGIEVDYAVATIEGNAVVCPLYEGMILYYCTASVIDNEITGVVYGEGIWIYDCYSVVIEGNLVDGCADGIVMYYTYDSVIASNTLTNNGLESGDTDGLYVYSCSNLTVADNVITGNYMGVEVYYTDLLTFSGNTVDGNLHDGAYFYSCSDLIVEENSFSENGGSGAWLDYCDYAVFGNNTVNENLDYGLEAGGNYGLRLYNGEFADNAYWGVYAYWAIDWIVDATALVQNNGVDLYGDLTIVSGGTMTLDSVVSFYFSDDASDNVPMLMVEEGGTLVSTNTEIYSYYYGEPLNGYHFEFEVWGTLDMENSCVGGAVEIYLAPTSSAEIRTSYVEYGWRNGIHVDNCSPVISGTTIIDNYMDGIFIEGANAAPKITDCLITYNERGIYAVDASLANVIDNLIVSNWVAGIYAVGCEGALHDNILLFNWREIYLKDSTMTVQDNQIGYSVLIDVMSAFAPLIMSGDDVPIFEDWMITPEDIAWMQADHIGIYAVDSEVTASDNVYGMLTYAVYVVRSTLVFSDTIELTTLVLPYYDDWDVLWNVSVPIYVYDGIYASESSVTVNGGMIEVLDDAIFLEASTADVWDAVLAATDFDFYLVKGTVASATGVTFSTAKVEDTSVLTVSNKLTVIAVDQNGDPVSGVWIVVSNAQGEVAAEGATGDDGKFSTYTVEYVQTSAGKSAVMNPYNVNGSFEEGYVQKAVSMDGPTEITLEVPIEEPRPWNWEIAVAIVLIAVFAIAIVLLMLRGGRP